eukprot:CAMPEP_0185473546 /NCGR_PEP_ID=MMETSP1366-20130426/1524_1 /TAXON_ID=38817 /ORGANISM="Gephyrocapsa oceanica, Strain RCC1303" /LENGTH=127 /DNA_ID=CAMNT_0028080413 /DNA_START=62 /DNA_END=441 /DNA_ORIENTATION=+
MSEQGLCPEQRAPVARRRSARRASRAAHAAPHVTQASVDAAASVAADRIAGNRRSEPTHDGAVRSRYGSPPVWAEVASGSGARAHAQRIGRATIEGERAGGGGVRHAVGEPQRRSGSGQTAASASQA